MSGTPTLPAQQAEELITRLNQLAEDCGYVETPDYFHKIFELLRAAPASGATQPSEPTLSRACDLLSMTIGTLMSRRAKIGYTDRSPVAGLVAEAVEFLRPWPEKLPSLATPPAGEPLTAPSEGQILEVAIGVMGKSKFPILEANVPVVGELVPFLHAFCAALPSIWRT